MIHRPSTIDEQGDRVRRRERGQPVRAFSSRFERLAARGENAQMRAAREQLFRRRTPPRNEMLAVIEQQEQRLCLSDMLAAYRATGAGELPALPTP